MEALLISVVVMAVAGLVILAAVGQHRRTRANLAALAERLGLQLVVAKKAFGFTESRVEGRWQGRDVRFWTYSTGSGKSRRDWVVAGVATPAGGEVAFELRTQGMLTKISEFFGAKEIQVGNPRFDAEWFVTTNRPAEFAAALLPEIQEKISALHAAGAKGTYTRKEGWVCYVEQGTFSSDAAIARLEGALPVLADLADVVDVCAARG